MPARKKYNYHPAKEFYIYGEWQNDNGSAVHFYPSLEDVAERFSDIPIASIKKESADNNWHLQRREAEKALDFKARKYAAELTQTSENLSEIGCSMSKILLSKVREIEAGEEIGQAELRALKDVASIYQTIESATKSLFRAKRDTANENNSQLSSLTPEQAREKKDALVKVLKETRKNRLRDEPNRIAFDDPEYLEQYGKERSKAMIKCYPNQVMEKMLQYQPGGTRHHVWLRVQAEEERAIDIDATTDF